MFSADFEIEVHGYKFAVEVRNWRNKKDALKTRQQTYDYLCKLSETRAAELHEMRDEFSGNLTAEDSPALKTHPLAMPARVQQARVSIIPRG